MSLININDKIYVAGSNGMVGSAICSKLIQEGYNFENKKLVISNKKDLDLADSKRVNEWFQENKPRIAFKIKIKITFLNEQDKYSTISSLISLLLKARINISEYYLEDEYLYIENEFIDPLKCAEEFTTLRYILQMSKIS